MADNEQEQREELSRCLDVLADGGQAQSTDAAVQEWLEAAVYVKTVFSPPPAVTDTTTLAAVVAGRLAARRQRFWLFSSMAGVAAAAVIALALHLLPASPDGGLVAQNTPAAPAAPAGAVADNPAAPVAPPAATPQDITASPPATKAAPDAVPPAADNAAANDNAVNDAVAESAATNSGAKTSTVSSAGGSRAIAFLSLPGRSADAVSVDRASGVIRQVYNLGAAGPLIITQRPRTAGQQVAMRSLAAQDGLNRVYVTVDGLDVTVEGRLPAAELQKIAAALVVRQVQP